MIPLTEREQQWMDSLRGCLCQEHEWLAGGAIGDQRTIIGLCRPPQDGEPMIARFTDGQGNWSHMHAVQRLMPGLYRCLIDGTIFDWPDEQVKVYSALSRISGGVRLDTSSWLARVED